jgi:hypothetical protein
MNSRSKCHRSVSSGAGLPLVIVLVVLAVGAHAQGQRDPTIPRAAFGLPGASGDALAPTLDAGPMTVIVRNGQPSLVVGTRLVAQGQTLGNTRVERITETEIWLREEGQLRKVPRFAGIQRRSSQP